LAQELRNISKGSKDKGEGLLANEWHLLSSQLVETISIMKRKHQAQIDI
jgi:hypothetical protein